MKVSIEKGELVIRMPMAKPTESKSGKTMLVATSHGAVTTQTMEPESGKPIVVSLNAYYKP